MGITMLRTISDGITYFRHFIILLTVAFGVTAGVSALDIKIASIAPENSPYGVALNQLAADWENISGGQVQVTIYHNGIAGDQADMLRKIRIGQIQGGVFTNTGISVIAPQVLSLSVPFLVRNDAEFGYVLKRITPLLDKALTEQGLKGLAWGEVGWVKFFSTEVLRTPDDLKTMRVAVPPEQQAFGDAFKLLGYRPVPLDMPETLSALNSGLVDVIYTSPLIVAGYQWFGVAKYMLNLDIAPAAGCIVLSDRAWNRVPQQFRSQFEAAAQRAARKIQGGLISLETGAVDLMKKYGLQITPVTPQIRREWQNKFETHFNDIVGPVFDRPTFDIIEKELKQYRNQ